MTSYRNLISLKSKDVILLSYKLTYFYITYKGTVLNARIVEFNAINNVFFDCLVKQNRLCINGDEIVLVGGNLVWYFRAFDTEFWC